MYAAAYPGVNHSWAFHFREGGAAGVRLSIFARIYCGGVTEVEITGKTRGQFLMTRGARQGCPESGFLSMASPLDHPKKSCRPRLCTALSACLR